LQNKEQQKNKNDNVLSGSECGPRFRSPPPTKSHIEHMKRFLSWNVNGMRAIEKKGFLPWLLSEQPDFLAIQETKAHKDQLSEALLSPDGYVSFWNAAQKKGYSGVAIYTKHTPQSVYYSFDLENNDPEGRVLILEYKSFYFLSIYFPNGNMSSQRLAFKLDFYARFLACVKKLLKKGKTLIVCGDVNTAHTEIDLARPKQNETVSGFLPEEREWIDRFIKAGLVDTFRVFNKDPGQYTWWDYKTRARERNVGWRIDYFFVDSGSQKLVDKAFILTDVFGSDHCPLGIDMRL
jgi:exodeoxyribonuclease III